MPVGACVIANAVAGAIGQRLKRHRSLLFMLLMLINWGVGPLPMGVVSYYFSSNLQLRCARRRHLGRHHLADPAAHGQQGNHQGED